MISKDTQKELASTAVIGAAGAGTSAVVHKLVTNRNVLRGLSKIHPKLGTGVGASAAIGGSLGLLADYGAVKLNNKLGLSGPSSNSGTNMINKQATFNALIDQGVSFEMASALVKQAAPITDYDRTLISPAWMHDSVSHRHGKGGVTSVEEAHALQHHGASRMALRSVGEGVGAAAAGGAVGHGVAHLAAKFGKTPRVVSPAGAVAGAAIGYLGGALHGVHASAKNQVADAHKMYSK
ncbi:MAG TPA: hypothetical protein VFM18_05240 [Methanosarcina sp.]|nr:hypothetical protein [Methanosarcina sp.]